jgi:hypothetical protein
LGKIHIRELGRQNTQQKYKEFHSGSPEEIYHGGTETKKIAVPHAVCWRPKELMHV